MGRIYLSGALVFGLVTSLPASAYLSIRFAHPVSLKRLDGSWEQSADGAIRLEKDTLKGPVLIQAEGKVPVILVPLDNESAELSVTLPDTSNWPNPQIQAALSQSLSQLMEQALEVQKRISTRNNTEAKTLVDQLLSANPRIAYLHFLAASVALTSGDKQAAINSLKTGLRIDPDNTKAKTMLRALEGTTP